MNNNHFPLLRYLLEKGYEAELLPFSSEFEHFDPKCDTFQDDEFPIIRTSFSSLPSGFWSVSKKEIQRTLSKYDYLIGTGFAPAFCNKANFKLDMFIPYGSDIYYIPFAPIGIERSLKKAIKRTYLKWHQRKGIQKCSAIIMDYTNPSYESLFETLGIEKKRFFSNPPFLFTPEYSPGNIENLFKKSALYNQFSKIRAENEIVVFHHSRHEWLRDEGVIVSDTKHTKGNQKLIIAFSRVLNKYSNKKIHLILFEYGSDVDRSKQLIKELGIEKSVTWFPIIPRREIMIGISMCDIGVGELDSSYFSYGAIYEFLAMAKPIIHYRDDSLYEKHYDTMYPMYSANTTDQVEAFLSRLVTNKEEFQETGIMGYKWFIENAVQRPLNFIIDQIEANVRFPR